MDNVIRVKQINLHHCKSATSLISGQLTSMQTSTQNQQLIVLAQEPWTINNKVQGFDENDLNVFYWRNTSTRPRALIITTKNVTAVQMP